MDYSSVTRPSPPSTKALVADGAFCAQVAALLLCDRGPIHDAFIGEPVEEVLEMARWALSHEDDEGFDTAEVLTAWAKKRGRGAWSERSHRTLTAPENPNGELARALVEHWVRHPEELIALLDRVETSINGRS
jgi:ABC-type hemin transport system ATPase subunit